MNTNELAEKVLPELLENRRTKSEIAQLFGVSERKARRLIQTEAKKYAIIANSQTKGYKKFFSDEDIENAIITVVESRSRRKELLEREKPILRELKKRGINI